MLGFQIRQANDLKHISIALVRAILEFNCVTSCPNSRVLIDTIEPVHRRFARLALRQLLRRGEMPDYHARSLLLGILSLAHRREVSRCVFVA